ncbi:MAG TPA: SOS response-associated peptidase [Oceanobacillus sp.]|nr:SOS response-associated peptidase [Oceanobacillus sp.]
MCGRFVLIADPNAIQQEFNLASLPDLTPRYNIAPTQGVAVITNEKPDELTFHRWGLIPSWAKEPEIGNKMINARSEGVEDKPAFRAAFKRRRCIIPASGFYEWKKLDAKQKAPMYIHLKDQEVFGLAGLWEIWYDPDGGEWRTATILTTDANEFMRPIHDRMPVILPRESYAAWLQPGEVPAAQLKPLLKPYDPNAMTAYEVSKLVNRPGADVPECIAPLAS